MRKVREILRLQRCILTWLTSHVQLIPQSCELSIRKRWGHPGWREHMGQWLNPSRYFRLISGFLTHFKKIPPRIPKSLDQKAVFPLRCLRLKVGLNGKLQYSLHPPGKPSLLKPQENLEKCWTQTLKKMFKGRKKNSWVFNSIFNVSSVRLFVL